MDRMISLSVGTKEAQEWFQTFQELSELAANLGNSHHYVSVSSSSFSDEDGSSEAAHYETVVAKARQAIAKASPDLTSDEVDEIVNQIHSAGITFQLND